MVHVVNVFCHVCLKILLPKAFRIGHSWVGKFIKVASAFSHKQS